jgi:hypothetical protein
MWLPDEATDSVQALLSAPHKDAIEALLLELAKAGAAPTDTQFHRCSRKHRVYCTITCNDQHMPRHLAPVFAVLYPHGRKGLISLVPGAALVEPDFPAFAEQVVRFNASSAASAAAHAVDASRRLGAWACALNRVKMDVMEAKSVALDAFLVGALDSDQLGLVAPQVSRQPHISASDVYVACLRQFSPDNYHKSMRQASKLTGVFSKHVLTMPRPSKLAEPLRGNDN